MRHWMIALTALIALPMGLWLLFAAIVWLDGDWQKDSYAVGWTFNMAIISSGFLTAITVPPAVIMWALWRVQEHRVRKRGWR